MSSQQVASASTSVEMVQFTSQAFRCPLCQTSFESAMLLRNHMESIHKKKRAFDKRFFCKACRKIFSLKNNLVRHLKQKPKCLRVYRKNYPESLEESQRPKPVKPFLAAEGITQNHQEAISPTFSSSDCVNRTINSQSFDRPLSQDDLNKKERSKRDKTTKLHACDDCGEVFNNNVSLWRHKLLRSGCQKADSSAGVPTLKSSLPIFDPNEHIITSTTSDGNCVKFYKCPECPKMFPKSHYLKMHMSAHSSLMTSCNICGKTCINNKSLKFHKKRMHADPVSQGQPENRPSKPAVSIQDVMEADDNGASDAVAPLIMTFKCSKCPKEFSSKGFLDQHESTHVLEKNLKFHMALNPQCQRDDQIPSSSASQQNMDTAITVVQKETDDDRTFKCPYCKRGFQKLSSMKQHTHVHNSVKRFSCNICGSGYVNKSNLIRHLNNSMCQQNGKNSSNENTLTSIGRIVRNDFMKAQSAETVSTLGRSEERQSGHLSSPSTSDMDNVTQAESGDLSQCNDGIRSVSPLNISASVSNINSPHISNSSDFPNHQISIEESLHGSKVTSGDSQLNNASLPPTARPSVINIQNQPLPLPGFYNPLNFVSFTQNTGNNPFNQTHSMPSTGLYNPFTLGSLGQTTASNISHFGVQNQGLGFYPFPNNPLFPQNWGFHHNAGMMIPNLPNFQQSLREPVVQPKTAGSFSIQNILK